MPRGTAHKQVMRALGCMVLAVFLVGFWSGPVRSCFSHPDHASAAEHEGSLRSVAGHRAPAAEHEGCTCLARCNVEQAPYLSGADFLAQAFTPHAPRALVAAQGRTHSKHDQRSLPLARPPPAVV
jgi:hypothetical protein